MPTIIPKDFKYILDVHCAMVQIGAPHGLDPPSF